MREQFLNNPLLLFLSGLIMFFISFLYYKVNRKDLGPSEKSALMGFIATALFFFMIAFVRFMK